MDNDGYQVLMSILSSSGLNISEIASHFGVSQGAVSLWKKRNRVPDHYTAGLHELYEKLMHNTVPELEASSNELGALREEISNMQREHNERMSRMDEKINEIKERLSKLGKL